MATAYALGKDSLTRPQRRVYEFMVRFQKEHGLPPTLREIFGMTLILAAAAILVWAGG